MGNSCAGQLRMARFQEVLHYSIEASLRSSTVVPRPVFSQLYLETEPLAPPNDDEDEENGSESSPPTVPYQKKPPPEGCCTTDGFCQAGRSVRLSSLSTDPLDVPPGFLLVGVKSSQVPDTLLVCVVDSRFLPDEQGRNALLGFSGNCVGCGEKGFRYFTEFANHINLKLSTQPKKQKHLKHLLHRNGQGTLVRGPAICWRGHGEDSDLVNLENQRPHVDPMGSHIDPVAPPPLADAPPAMTNGNHALPPSANQPPSTRSGPGRPTSIGLHANAGPPKKRHKGWSPDSAAPTLVDSGATVGASGACLGSLLSLPSHGASVTVPDHLLQTCRLQPVIFNGHGPLPQLCGNVGEVLVSSLLQTCYLSSQTLPRIYQHYGPSPIQPLSTEMQILLTVYYLVQLGPDQVPLVEDLEQIFMRSWRESHLSEIRQYQQPGPAHPDRQQSLSPSQLPWLAQLAASSCGEGVLVLGESEGSLAQGLTQTFSRLLEGQLASTNYVVIIVTAVGQETQSCVVVTGKHQCRAVAESMYSPSEGLREMDQQLSSGLAQDLAQYCSSLGPGTQESLEKKYQVEWRAVRPIQLAVARKLLSHVCAIADSSTQNLDLGSFDRLSFLICVPPSEVTFQQTLLHLRYSGVLQEMGGVDQEVVSPWEAERYVVKMDHSAAGRIDDLVREARSNSYTLYILVHDHAHWDVTSGSYFSVERGEGLVDQLLNSRQVTEAPNVLILHVTSFPFALQTQNTRISPYNEIHWPSAFSNDVDLYHEKTRYLGVSELLESTRLGSSLPLMRYDSSFESMTSALEDRFPKLHSAVIRTTVLVQHYCVALMAASGRLHSAQNHLHKHTSVETLEIVQSLIGAGRRCPAHHGPMVLLRIPSLALAAWAQRRLADVRRRLGLEDTFEIILGNPGQPLSVGHTFTERIKIQDVGWVPGTYLELEGLPCILILSGAEPLGESLPRSLKYCDLRVISSSYLQRTTLEQELGLAAYLVRAESRPPHDPGPGSDLLESDADKLSSTDNEEEEAPDTGTKRPLRGPRPGDHAPPPPGASSGPLPALPPPDPPATPTRPPSKSTSSDSLSPRSSSSPAQSCSWARGVSRPPSVLLPRALYDIITASDGSGLPRCTSFLPHMSVAWASSFRPLLSKMMTCTEQSLYYRQWTAPRAYHMDRTNRTEGRSDNFHPRRLLLSGPPQVGKTGAYLHFLGILSRMLIRLMEVDIYDEEDIHCAHVEGVQYHPAGTPWPIPEVMRSMPFDYTVHDPKYDDVSNVYCPGHKPSADAEPPRQEDVYLRRRTSRMKLSKHAAYNTYHHCEQCHQYMGFNPRYQMCESSLHTFTFSHLQLGDEIQLFFIIPKSKEHYFSFSQSGGQLESLRLPLTSEWSPDCIKSPIFMPTTGRHEHGLFNLFHAMDGAAHLHILVVKEYEMPVYKKYWPNHIMLVLPSVFNGAGIGAAHFLIKELSHHNLALERSRRQEGGGPPGDVWPFVVVADDSCVMWNAVDIDAGQVEHGASLKQVLQTMEACPDLAHLGLCGLRKWNSRGLKGQSREPFHRGQLHDFLLVNVDLCRDVPYDRHRFSCHDVDFALRAHSAGLLLCRFNGFSVMKKQIAIGGYRTFIIKTKMTDVPTSVGPLQYVCAPDSKHLFLATPARLLLERYLQHTGHQLFPLGTRGHAHPVLSVDCFLNLGPEVTVCFVSSRPHSLNLSTAGLLFSGLLLCFTDSCVTPSFLKKFTFLQGATLCVICADRSSLRQAVGRLELEDEWRFRLSDEFQTANAKEDLPLFFLTGKHI
uniref:Growth regulating estrogen receptor binding 1 n=1 Tax=Gadus morhua TaxID=8049 RepID=A0A8C4ZPI0_GADMO